MSTTAYPVASARVTGDLARYRDPDIELADRSTIEAMQRERLAEIVEYAYARSAFTKALWDANGVSPADVRTLEDFVARAPFFVQSDPTDFGARNSDPFGGLLSV